MCYIVFISHSLHWHYIKTALQEYVIKSVRKEFQDLNQQDQAAMQRKRKQIFPQVMMKTNFLL